jgi:hypothetical protein
VHENNSRSAVGVDCYHFSPFFALVGRHDEGLPFLDDVRRELRSRAAADVLHGVDGLGRDEEDLADADRRRRLAVDAILERSLEQ